MQPSYCIVISTADRHPARDYLIDTLNGLMQAGVMTSLIPHEIIVVDTGKGILQRSRAAIWLETHRVKARIVTPDRAGSSPDNAAAGLREAFLTNAHWVIFLEDDIETCGSFLESVDGWLRDNATPDVPVYPFCAAYGRKEGRERDMAAWPYGLGMFYGTQAYAIRAEDCPGAADFLEREAARRNQINGHDLLLRDWILDRYPDTTNLLAPGVDFVQHVGRESGIHPGRFHLYPHFPGREWSYEDRNRTYFGLDELKRSKFSPNIARLLGRSLDPAVPVYDMGCGVGNYLASLERSGFVGMGIEGHPRAVSVAVTPSVMSHDLSVPLPRRLLDMPRGSVISIEVGEHIHPERCQTFLDNLVAMCAQVLIISWAIRGQGGLRHVNELDEHELVPLIERRGFRLDRDKTDAWRKLAVMDAHWFGKSLYCFERNAP